MKSIKTNRDGLAAAGGQHTPPPWTIVQGYNIMGPKADGGSVYIALIRAENPARAHANWRLIVTAPEMLDALRTLVEACDDVCSCGKCGGCIAVNAARAIIAKATGVKP